MLNFNVSLISDYSIIRTFKINSMKLRSLLMFLGCFFGGIGGLGYWYSMASISGNFETGSNLFSAVLYGIFIGIFIADFLSQGTSRKEA